jgi:hypothetical protein
VGLPSCVVHPLSCVTKVVTTHVVGGIFGALTSWVLASVEWFLNALGQVLTTAAEPSTIIRSATPEFTTLATLAPGLMLIGLLVATLQAIRHGDGASLWRVYLGVAPASVLAIFVARPLASLVLGGVNQLTFSASNTVALHAATLNGAILALSPTTPGFGLFILAIALVIGTFLLWCELIVRAVVLTLLLVLAPVIISLSTFPAGRRLGWRLAETFLAIAASKFLIVVTLTLGLDEIQGSSATEIVTGAVTLLIATLSPFLLLKIIPFVEQSSLHHLEGVRTHFTRAAANVSNSPVASAARALMPDAPIVGPEGRPADLGLGMWEGVPETPLEPFTGEQLAPPIGKPTLRGGHVAYYSDEGGPVVGWHFDE